MVRNRKHSWRGFLAAWRRNWLRSWSELFVGVRIEDDRGKRVPLVKRGAIGEGLSDFRRRELRTRIPVDRMKLLVLALVLIGAGMAGRVAWLAISGQPIFVGGIWMILRENLWIPVWLVAMSANMFRTNPAVDYTERVVSPCLKWGVCASCGYTLRDAKAQEDGCVVCSECGAAWKRDRVG